MVFCSGLIRAAKGNCSHTAAIRVRFYRFALLLAIVLNVGCTQPQPDLRIATNQWLGYEPLYLARDLGYLSSTPIRFFELPNSTAVLNAFRNRAIDIAALTLDEALLLQHDGMDVRILLVLDISHGADVLLAKPGIKNLADLKGKRIGLESGALGAYLLSRSLSVAGLKPADVIVVPLTVDNHAQAYHSGSIDALVTFGPVRTGLLKAGATVIFDSSDIPNEIFDVLVVNADIYEARRDDLQKLAQAWFLSLEYIAAHPEDAVERMSPRLDLTPAEVLAGMDEIHWGDKALNRRLLSGDKPGLLEPADKMARIMLQYKLIVHPVNIPLLIDKQFQGLLQ